MATATDTLSDPAVVPDARGRFGLFGGRFVPETLMDALDKLTTAYEDTKRDPSFQAELDGLLADYVGRPSRLFFAERLTKMAGGAAISLLKPKKES